VDQKYTLASTVSIVLESISQLSLSIIYHIKNNHVITSNCSVTSYVNIMSSSPSTSWNKK